MIWRCCFLQCLRKIHPAIWGLLAVVYSQTLCQKSWYNHVLSWFFQTDFQIGHQQSISLSFPDHCPKVIDQSYYHSCYVNDHNHGFHRFLLPLFLLLESDSLLNYKIKMIILFFINQISKFLRHILKSLYFNILIIYFIRKKFS